MSGSSESAESSMYWVDWFLGQRGNEFFCEVDEEYIQDRFNLTGLNTEVPMYAEAYEMLLEPVDLSLFNNANYVSQHTELATISSSPNQSMTTASALVSSIANNNPSSSTALPPGSVDHPSNKQQQQQLLTPHYYSTSTPHPTHPNAPPPPPASPQTLALSHDLMAATRHLYGLIHARYILTARGQLKMFDKARHAEFGRCPRVLCHNQPVLPCGLSDLAGVKNVMLYCPRCEDVYSPPSRRHASVDGAYFGTTFPHLLVQVYPQLVPALRGQPPDRYVPKIFGFKINTIAGEQRKQDEIREAQLKRVTSGFAEE